MFVIIVMVRCIYLEVRKVSRPSTCHVMLVIVGGELGPELQEADHQENLPLGTLADVVPEGRGVGVHIVRELCAIHVHSPREFESISVNDVTDEGKHGDSPMLDFSMAEEANGSLVRCSPELSFCQVQGIIELYQGVKLYS